MIYRNIICVAAILITIKAVHAQNSQPNELKYYLKQCEYFLQDGGKWKAVNKDFNPKDEWSANYFGYEYSKGINPNTLRLKITGYFPKKSQWLIFWDGFYTWDSKKKKVVYQSVNSEGAIATGESESISEPGMNLIFSITSPAGKVEKHRDIQKLVENQIQSKSFIQKDNKWKLKNSIVWSRLEQPKGNLTFMTTRDGNFEVYSMDTKGESLKNLTCNKAIDYAFSYLPDGRLSFYTNRDGNDEIYIMDADGRKQTNITNNPAGDRIACASPDGNRILFVSDRDQQRGEIYIMDVDGKNIIRFTNNEYFEDAPFWSPDGKKILFTRELRDLKDTSKNAVGNGEIFVMDADGTNETRLTNRPGYDGGAIFSPDGKQIAFYGKTETGNYDIFLMDADGKNIINLTDDPMEDYSPSWSPDSKWIAYTKGDSKNYDVWLIHIETKIKTRLTTQPKRDESPFWQPEK